MLIPQQTANTRLTPNPGPLPTEQAMGAWFAVAAARSQMQQELARRRQQQQLHVQLQAHQQAQPQQALQLSPLATSQDRPLSRTQRILQEQLFQHQRAGLGPEPPRIGQVQATSSPAASPSLPSQPQQAQFTYPAESMAAAVAIAGAQTRKPVVSSRAFSSPNLPSQPPQQA